MDVRVRTPTPPIGHIRRTVSAALGCEPRRTATGVEWVPGAERPGIRSAVLRPESGGRHELNVTLALVPEAAPLATHVLWQLAATLIKDTDLTTIPVAPVKDESTGMWRIMAQLTLRDAAFDLPRSSRLSQAMMLLDESAKAIQAELPMASGTVPKIPQELHDVVEHLSLIHI